jgi:hypothetical protein
MPSLTVARGLVTLQSELARPDGALEVADNTIIDADNVIESRRGFAEFGSETPDETIVKQLMTYKGRILRHFSNIIQYDSDGNGTFQSFAGSYQPLIDKLRIKYLEANSNLYFTTSTGIKKISATSASDFTTAANYITDAGGIKATSIEAKIKPSAAGWLPAQSKAAYKVVWASRDANGNIIRGVPSSRVVITNTSKDVNIGEAFKITILNAAAIANSEYFVFSTPTNKYGVWFKVSGTPNPPSAAELLGAELVQVDLSTLLSITPTSTATKLAETLFSISEIEVEVSGAEVTVTNTQGGDVLNPSQGSFLPSEILIANSYDGQTAIGTPANGEVTFVVPSEVNPDLNFYELYRTAVATVQTGQTLSDIDPGEEFQKIYEFPVTAADITAGEITVEDIAPENFREVGAFLYTNAATGEGAANANEAPPVAHDIALFKNATFYANTRERHRKEFTLLSVSDFTSGISKFYVGKGTSFREYTFVGTAQQTNFTVATRSLTVGGSYFIINSAQNRVKYKLWFDKGTILHNYNSTTAVAGAVITINSHGFANNDAVTFSGTIAPELTSGTTYYVKNRAANTFEVSATIGGPSIVLTDVVGTGTITHNSVEPFVNDTISLRVAFELYPNDTIADSVNAFIDAFFDITDFEVEDLGAGVVAVYNNDNGDSTDPVESSPATGWSQSVVIQGQGEDAASQEVLLSGLVSVGQSVEDTAKSLERVINKDPLSPVNAFYLSGLNDIPGKLLLESRSLDETPFFCGVNEAPIATKFNPEMPVAIEITSVVTPSNVFTTASNHDFTSGQEVYISPDASFVHQNSFKIATTPAPNTFTVTNGSVLTSTDPASIVFLGSVKSDNSVNPNRLYFSKNSQPEAVPLINFIDVGPKDKAIQRIIALRDSLIVLKEDGVYVVSGSVSPNFSVRLVDSSALVMAPDTAVNLNNLIYVLSTQGIVTVSETGVGVISRNIENKIQEVTNARFDFKLTSWAIASESDRAYIIWLPTKTIDGIATQAYRYNLFTRAWTRWTIPANCGVINPINDKIYLGSGSGRDYVLEERKNFDRTDYADRDFIRSIGPDAIVGDKYTLSAVTDIEAGDVLTQFQYLDINKYNRLLKKLDRDVLPSNDYFSTLKTKINDNMATKLDQLATKLQADGVMVPSTSMVNDPEIIRDEFNAMIVVLNALSSPTGFKNYKQAVDLLSYETVITEVKLSINTVTVKKPNKFLLGQVTVFKGIACKVQYAPQHFGKPEVTKQVTEGTFIFDQNNFWGGSVAYSSDRSYDFTTVQFGLKGPGYWDGYNWADTTFGGLGNEVPVRTLIPRDKSRCRYIHVQFNHINAREVWRLLGVSLEPREISTRGYR